MAIEGQRMRADFPLAEAGQRPGRFRDHAFADDAATDTGRCPGGETLRFRSQSEATRRRIYQAPARACGACARRAQCTTAPRGRRVSRDLAAADIARVRGDHATEDDGKAMRKRKVWAEPLCAEATDWHGLRRFRPRCLDKVNGEALLIAAGQNLKRLLSKRGGGRRPWPGGAAGVVLPAAPPVPVPSRSATRRRSPARPHRLAPPRPTLVQQAGPFVRRR